MEALEDDRVHDETSFHAAVQARQRRHEEEERGQAPKRWAQEDGKEYPDQHGAGGSDCEVGERGACGE